MGGEKTTKQRSHKGRGSSQTLRGSGHPIEQHQKRFKGTSGAAAECKKYVAISRNPTGLRDCIGSRQVKPKGGRAN